MVEVILMDNTLKLARSTKFWSNVRSNTFFASAISDIYSRERSFCGLPEDADYSLFCEFWKSGNRASYEANYYKKRDYMNIYATLAMLEPENVGYIRKLENIIWIICNEFTWCITAHIGAEGREPDEYKEYIDLFAAETASALAEIKYMLGDRLSPLICRRINREIEQRIKKPFCETRFSWEKSVYNWNAVCSGCVGAALIYEFPQCFDENKNRIIENMNCFLSGYKEDGACVEGLGYWAYGFGYFVCFAELLREYSSGEIDLLNGEKQRQIAMFQQKMYLCAGKRATFADTEVSVTHYYVGLTHFIAKEYAGVRIPVGVGFPKYASNDNCFHWMLHIRNFLWTQPDTAVCPVIEENYMSEGAIYTKINDIEAYGFFTKAGKNSDAHAHCDIGGFIFVRNGDVIIDDIGSGEYSAATFGSQRNLLITHSSLGHSVPIINGCSQHWNESAKGCMRRMENGRVDIQMHAAYPFESGISSMVREFEVSKQLKITDRVIFKSSASEFRERFTTRLKVNITDDKRVLLIGNCGIYEIEYDKAMFYPEMSTEYFIAIYGRKDYVNLVDFICKVSESKLIAQFLLKDVYCI